MENKRIWISSPHIGENEFKYVTEAFDLNWIAPIGPHLNKFEEKLTNVLSENFLRSEFRKCCHFPIFSLYMRRNKNKYEHYIHTFIIPI